MPGQHSLTEEDAEALMSGGAPEDRDRLREEAIKRERDVQEAMRKLLDAQERERVGAIDHEIMRYTRTAAAARQCPNCGHPIPAPLFEVD